MRVASQNGLIEQLPWALRRFLTLEQQNLWKPGQLRVPGFVESFDRKYLPESSAVFELPCFWIQRKHLYNYGAREGPSTAFWEGGEGPEARVLFPIHPSGLQNYAPFLACVGAQRAILDTRILASPTSSTRTLLVWLDGDAASANFVKVSLWPGILGDRRLSRRRVACSVGLSLLLDKSQDNLSFGIRHFREPRGLVPRLMANGGVIFREIPPEVMAGAVIPAALFALIGGGGENPPLLIELARNGCDYVKEFLEEVLLRRFARIWVNLVFKGGLLLEAHGQDLLLGLSPDGLPLGTFYYRDCEGIAVDWMLRRAVGLPEQVSLPHTCEWFNTYETWGYPLYQLVFCKMRTSLYDYLYFVLTQLELAVAEWAASGIIRGPKILGGRLTSRFSGHLRGEIRERFGMAEADDYDISEHLDRFVKFLMGVRAEILANRVR